MQHFRRNAIRRNLLEMYRDNAIRSQSYMDTVRLHRFMATMTQIEMERLEKRQSETVPRARQAELFPELSVSIVGVDPGQIHFG